MMVSDRAMAALCVATSVGLVAPVDAQVTYEDLERIEDGTSDLGPLGTSTRVMPLELQEPNDFGSIYEVHSRDGGTHFVRFSGGTAAVFPRSVYVETSGGFFPDVPPGTVYYIDGLPESLFGPMPDAARPSNPYQVSYRHELGVSHRYAGPQGAPGPEGAPARHGSLSIWTGEEHRRRRVSQLVREAAAVETQSNQGL